jgi:single-strand DNA-binding protein
MASVNKAILVGRLGRDPEMRVTPQGTPVVNFSLATTDRLGPGRDGQPRQERTEWHNIVAFGKLAELVNQYLKKGRSAYIEGRIQTRTWDDRDGNKRNRTEIVAQVVQFLDSRGGNGGARGAQAGAAAPAGAAEPPDAPAQTDEPLDAPEGASASGEDELPF